MTWSSWVGKVGSLPQVLAGPILRATSTKSVTVWVATKSSTNVTLRVFDTANSNAEVLVGNRATVQLATNLHVCAVTVKTNAGTGDLAPGRVYS
jgi:hypothetical protein